MHAEAPGSGAFVSKVIAMFRPNEKAAAPSASMIVNVRTLTEEHTDPAQQLESGESQWKSHKGQAGRTFVQTGL